MRGWSKQKLASEHPSVDWLCHVRDSISYHSNASYTAISYSSLDPSSPPKISLCCYPFCQHSFPSKNNTSIAITSVAPSFILCSYRLATITYSWLSNTTAPCTKRQRISTVAKKKKKKARLPCTKAEPWGQEGFG